jgi:predicted Zn-dependent protease
MEMRSMNQTRLPVQYAPWWLSCAMAVALSTALPACKTVVNPVSGKKEIATMDEGEEIANGRAQHEEILKQYPRLNNPALQTYVTGVGMRIARESHRPSLPWTITVLDSPEVNAFATTGGYVYITRGIMAHLNSEEELAGVLGHEMGHITARHVARQDRDQKVAGFGLLLATIAGAYVGGERGAQAVQQVGGGLAQGFVLLPHSRDHENQADGLGVEYLDRAGYNPKAMVRVIEVLKLQENYAEDEARAGGAARLNRMPAWMATHPANDERLAHASYASGLRPAKPNTDAGRERYLRAIDGIVFGDSRENGVMRGRQFFHEPLNFTMTRPERWKFQNESDKLTVISPDQTAAVVIAPANPRGNHEQAIRNMLKPDTGRSERITINGNPATYFSGARQGNPVEATVVSITNADFMMVPLAKSPQAQQQYRREVLEIMNSVRRMNAEDVRRAQPTTLRVVPMPRSAPGQGFRELARNVPESGTTENQLRLINQAYPSGTIEPGRLVKTIQ